MSASYITTALTALLSLTAITITTAFHYEAINMLQRRLEGRGARRRWVPAVLLGLVMTHLLEIGFYAVVFALGAGPFGLGAFSGGVALGPTDYFYVAAETYSSLGYGDLVPTGDLRLIASIEPLNGLLLLAWSGSFLFEVVTRARRCTPARPDSLPPAARERQRSEQIAVRVVRDERRAAPDVPKARRNAP